MATYVVPADAAACGHNRLIWPANCLMIEGHDIRVMPPGPGSGFTIQLRDHPSGVPVVTGIELPQDVDVVVVQRPAHPFHPQLFDILRHNGIAVVVDMDDDMSNIHPDNRAFHMYRPGSGTELSWRHTLEACKRATLVTTSTAQLQKVYARHGRGRVLDNYVPEAYLGFDTPDTGAFGWAGTLASHPNDPQVLRPAVQRLIDDGHRFTVLGDGRGVRQAMGLARDPDATGSVSLVDWARMIATTMDVGLVPLAPTAFNSSKSRLKGIEYMAVGVPWVASPRAEYRKLVKDSGCGFLADTGKDWYALVKALMDDDTLRKEQAERGREYMIDQTYQANAWRWAEAWQWARDFEQGRVRNATVVA